MPTHNLDLSAMPKQRRPTCGLYALTAVAKALNGASVAKDDEAPKTAVIPEGEIPRLHSEPGGLAGRFMAISL